MLAFTLSLAAVTASWTYAAAGSRIPMMVARYVADFADFDQLLMRGVLLTMALILPTSACLGAAFPFALALADDRLHPAPGPLRPGLRDQHARIGDGLAGRGVPLHSGFRHSADAVDRERLPDRVHGWR